MTAKQKKTAIENLLNRYYKAAVNVEYYMKELRTIQEKFEEYFIGKDKSK